MANEIDAKHDLNLGPEASPATANKSELQTKGGLSRWFMKMLSWANSEAGTDQVDAGMRSAKENPIAIQDGVATITAAQLKSISIFENCADSLLKEIAAKFQSESFPMGRKVISKGDVADKFYILARGEVLVSETRANSDKLYLAKLNEMDCLGEIALLRGINRTADVETVTPCIFLTLGRQDFMAAVDAMPELRKAVEDIIQERESADERAELLRRLSEV